jgi:hypothetical protein
MAIAAGVNLILSHEFMSTMSMMRYDHPNCTNCLLLMNADFSPQKDAAIHLTRKPMDMLAVRPLPALY